MRFHFPYMSKSLDFSLAFKDLRRRQGTAEESSRKCHTKFNVLLTFDSLWAGERRAVAYPQRTGLVKAWRARARPGLCPPTGNPNTQKMRINRCAGFYFLRNDYKNTNSTNKDFNLQKTAPTGETKRAPETKIP